MVFHGDPDHVGRDFLIGSGTAVAPPVILMILLVLFLLAARRRDSWGRASLWGIVVTGVANVLGYLGEPNALRVVQPLAFDPGIVLLLTAGIITAAVMAAIAAGEALRHRA